MKVDGMLMHDAGKSVAVVRFVRIKGEKLAPGVPVLAKPIEY